MAEVKKAVVEAYMEERISKKSGSKYVVLVLEFENGYKTDTFLSNEQKFILQSIVPFVV